jgi:E3 ubiquitin-protein ligase SHPRH
MTNCVSSVIINLDQLQRFTVEADKPAPAKPVMANKEPVPVSRRKIQYNMISQDTSNYSACGLSNVRR